MPTIGPAVNPFLSSSWEFRGTLGSGVWPPGGDCLLLLWALPGGSEVYGGGGGAGPLANVFPSYLVYVG